MDSVRKLNEWYRSQGFYGQAGPASFHLPLPTSPLLYSPVLSALLYLCRFLCFARF